MGKKKSQPPKNLSITRSGDTYTCSWACGDKNYNDNQNFKYAIDGQHGWKIIKKIGKNNWSRNLTVSRYGSFNAVRFSVQGNRDKSKNDNFTMSSWSKECVFAINYPRLPVITPTPSIDPYYKTTFAWSITANDSDSYIYTDCVWESIVVETSTLDGPSMASVFTEAAKQANRSRYGYKSGVSTNTSGSETISEDNSGSFNLANGKSWTRWFRMRTHGPRGWNPDWTYSYHTYAMPTQINDVKVELIEQDSKSGYTCGVNWTSSFSEAHPTTKAVVNYALANPVTSYIDSKTYVKTSDTEIITGKSYYVYDNQNETYTRVTNPVVTDLAIYYEEDVVTRKFTIEPPQDISWGGSISIDDNHGSQHAAININDKIDDNKCLFISVSVEYDIWTGNNAVFSKIIIVPISGVKYGTLSMPEGIAITPTSLETGQYTITATNTASSNVSASYLAVYYRTGSMPNIEKVIGIIAPGSSSTVVYIPTNIDITDPRSFGVKAFLADYSYQAQTTASYREYYLSAAYMESAEILWSKEVPLPPANVQPVKLDKDTIQVTWGWTWSDATGAELSWADHEDAWESTDEPSTFIIKDNHAGKWNISGLSVGKWYVRMRLLQEEGDKTTYGTYSGIKTCVLSESPNIPAITVPDSEKIVAPDGKFTCYWSYVTNDGTSQMNADIGEVVYKNDGTIDYYEPLANVESVQHYTFYLGSGEGKLNWQPGTVHDIAVRVTSASGERSEDWSPSIQIQVAEPLVASIDETSLKTIVTEIDMEDPLDYQITDEDLIAEGEPSDISLVNDASPAVYSNGIYLTKLPLEITVSGAGSFGRVTGIIERFEDYDAYRPNDEEYDGFEGETIAIKEMTGDGVLSFTKNDVFGYLDDGAKYKLTIMITDASGQTATVDVVPMYIKTSDESIVQGKTYYTKTVVDNKDVYTVVSQPDASHLRDYYELTTSEFFIVKWDHQAQIPEASVELDYDNLVAYLTPTVPDSGYEEGDTCDIYRLSADRPELVVAGAEFGTAYVDPYPTLGETFSGYRFVYKTLYGDYMTSPDADVRTMAWYNYNVSEVDEDFQYLDLFAIVIDYEEDQIILPYNIDISNSWTKDFTSTKYLGGSVQGDWNPSVDRSSSLNTMTAVIQDAGTIQKMRAFAAYPGVCHVRTPDGSSFAANIDVTESREERKVNMVASFSLNITRVDSEGFDGMPYEEWSESA